MRTGDDGVGIDWSVGRCVWGIVGEDVTFAVFGMFGHDAERVSGLIILCMAKWQVERLDGVCCWVTSMLWVDKYVME